MHRYIDLFCGIGGFRIAFEQICKEKELDSQCVFSSDIDPFCRTMYEANFNEQPFGDIQQVDAKTIPDHDLLFAGFPCQPFSIIGPMKGLNDTRGTLFFDIARILKEKKPKAFVLENQINDYDQAKNTYEVFIEEYPDHPMRDDAEYSIKNMGKSPEELIKEFEANQEAEEV